MKTGESALRAMRLTLKTEKGESVKPALAKLFMFTLVSEELIPRCTS
jgi:hypothetical protein